MNIDILNLLTRIYNEETAFTLLPRLETLIEAYRPHIPQIARDHYFDQRDAVLITYGDMVHEPEKAPLNSLAAFLQTTVADVISTVHILPFYPYSSDDGFSVIDYEQVDPNLGDWTDVAQIGRSFRLMFDAVVNHISAESDWFQAFLRDEAPYRDYFVTVAPDVDLTAVFRPRALPLLTKVETGTGIKYVWTTFSDDQIDLNFANPNTLLAVMQTLLLYISQGAEFIRLDAIAYIWKEIGTTCIHLPQTHAIIQLIRAVLNTIAPQVVLITETNVPHKDNISYFGDGHNEAQMVYNFPLPPLTLHAFHTGQSTALSQWAATLETPSDEVTYFNFLASHDGIGVTPARGLLADAEVKAMAQRVEALGGYVSYKTNPDGSQSAYELNINYLDALGDPANKNEPDDLKARRFLAAQAIMLALRGVPGIYFHSLFGSQSWPEGVQATGRARTINRQKLPVGQLTTELAQPGSLRSLIFPAYRNMLHVRAASLAFHPNGQQEVVLTHPSIFALWRRSGDGETAVLCLHNVSNKSQKMSLPFSVNADNLTDLLTDSHFKIGNGRFDLTMAPYQVLWLVPAHNGGE